ncbi:hypothetical protein BHE74_00052032 [Ensete ventricosum]|nr:hypothetical protein BHE74_00052032 [Ensete ventricosum]
MAGFMTRLFVLVLVSLLSQECLAATFTLANNCDYTVWPGVLSSAGDAALATMGFAVETGQSKSLDAPATCGGGGIDYYDVSLVDGYNLPMLVAPRGSSGGDCGSTGCVMYLNGVCPSDLKVVARSSAGAGEGVACKSAWEAFGFPQYCCSGGYSNPATCTPSPYFRLFKNACPRAYSYAFDDATSTFTCSSADYLITFCPSTTR